MAETPKHFSTVETLLAYLNSSQSRPGGVLFRGEKMIFSSSMPGTPRVLTDRNLTFDQRTFLIDFAMRLQELVEEATGAESDHWDMFLQHYGAPTDLMDFTDDPVIAAFFAFKDEPRETGRVAILPIETAAQHLDLISYREFRINGQTLKRPLRQKAWAVRHRPGHPYDFAAAETVEMLGIEWVTFDKKLQDPDLFRGCAGILESSDDIGAAVMRDWLEYCRSSAWQSGLEPVVARIESQL